MKVANGAQRVVARSRAAGICLALGLLVSACGSTVDLAAVDQGGGPLQDGFDVPGTSTVPNPVGSGTSYREGLAGPSGLGPAPVAVGTPGPGSPVVQPNGGTSTPRATPLKVGVIIPKGNAGAALGVGAVDTDPAQARAEIKALQDRINATGGFGGHPITLFFQELDRSDESAGTMTLLQNQICAAMTEDAKVAVVIAVANASTTFANDCYARHRTPVLTLTPGSERDFSRLAPWLLPPYTLNISRMARLMPVAFKTQGFLTQRMAVVTYDRKEYHDLVDKDLAPAIVKAGGKVVDTAYLPTNAQDLAPALATAVLRFRNTVDRVVMLAPGGGTWVLFAHQAESQDYHPRYGVSSMDSPHFTSALLPPRQLVGTVGAGYMPQIDVAPAKRPPVSATAKACWKLLNEKAGGGYTTDDTPGILALNRCEAMYLAQAGFRALLGRPLDRAQVRNSFFAVGTSYRPVQFPKLRFSAGKVDAIDVYAPFRWDSADCNCFDYAGGFRDIPD